jgi:hypothetical protein
MTQNIYDNPGFFAGYSQLPRSRHGLDGAPEWPALRGLLPELRGLRVLDLGCGFGWFCRFARQQGAAGVLGIDVSERMLARARNETSDAAISYLQADLEQLTLCAAQFRFRLFVAGAALHRKSRAPARLRSRRAGRRRRIRVLGRTPGLHGARRSRLAGNARPQGVAGRPLSRRGSAQHDWLAKGVIKQHRTIATYFALLRRAGFVVTQIDEWGPSPEQVAAQPDLASRARSPAVPADGVPARVSAGQPGIAVSTRRAQNEAPTGITSSLKS